MQLQKEFNQLIINQQSNNKKIVKVFIKTLMKSNVDRSQEYSLQCLNQVCQKSKQFSTQELISPKQSLTSDKLTKISYAGSQIQLHNHDDQIFSTFISGKCSSLFYQDDIEIYFSDDIRRNLRENRMKELHINQQYIESQESPQFRLSDFDHNIDNVKDIPLQDNNKNIQCNKQQQLTFKTLKRERCKNYLYTLKNMIKSFMSQNITKFSNISQQAQAVLTKYFGTNQKCQLAELNTIFQEPQLRPMLAEFFYDSDNRVLFELQTGKTNLKNKKSFIRCFLNTKRSFLRGKITALTL